LASRVSKRAVLPVAGVLVILFYCAFTLTSVLLFPRPVSPLNDWLSDLGNSSYNPRGAIFYNVGCVLTGLALLPFFVGFYYWYTDEKWRKSLIVVTQAVGFIAAFALIMIGVFSEDAGAIHHLWSLMFFISNLLVSRLAVKAPVCFLRATAVRHHFYESCGVYCIELSRCLLAAVRSFMISRLSVASSVT
jgi:hypothetical membrane protein